MSNLTDTQLAQLKTVLVHEIGHPCYYSNIGRNHNFWAEHLAGAITIQMVKPYLRRITEDVKMEMHNDLLLHGSDRVMWCLQNHFDIFNLIGQGLALEKGAENG